MPDGPQETPYGEPLRVQPSKEPLKMLPVLFVLCVITTLYLIYVVAHCLPMLQLSVPPNMVDSDMRYRAIVETIIFHVITFFLVISYVRCVMVHPGEVPHHDPWLYTTAAGAKPNLPIQETKKSGERRHCKWCGKYKPDRCHHCRVCQTCILKMDHHCPWIYNCVGFYNYKYFFLLLFYVMLDLQFILWTMPESMVRAIDDNAPFLQMFFVLFGLTLAFFLGSLVTLFFGFHVWLTSLGLTTIEFCEKRLPKKSDGQSGGGCMDCCENDSMFNLGLCGNLQATLGDNPLFWLLPFAGPSGDGLIYDVTDIDTSLPRDLEFARGSKKKPGSSRKIYQKAGHQGYGTVGSGGSLFEQPGMRYSRQYQRGSKEPHAY